jgi:hypothetical protein
MNSVGRVCMEQLSARVASSLFQIKFIISDHAHYFRYHYLRILFPWYVTVLTIFVQAVTGVRHHGHIALDDLVYSDLYTALKSCLPLWIGNCRPTSKVYTRRTTGILR